MTFALQHHLPSGNLLQTPAATRGRSSALTRPAAWQRLQVSALFGGGKKKEEPKKKEKLTPEQYGCETLCLAVPFRVNRLCGHSVTDDTLAQQARGTYADFFKTNIEEKMVDDFVDTNAPQVPYLPILLAVIVALLGVTFLVVQKT